MLRRFQTEDGYVFHLQPDGTLTDNEDPNLADQTYANLEELTADGMTVKEIEPNTERPR